MGWLRTSGVLFACAVTSVLATGCGKDFDALFANGPDASTEAGGPDAAACSPPATECNPKSGTDDGKSTYACNGCGCTCPSATCPAPASKGCSGTCGVGASCNLGCDTEGPCNLTCKSCKGVFSCGEHTKTCAVTCDDGATCSSKCDADDSCTLTCKDGSACLLTCTSRPGTCTIDCEGVKKECGNRVFACNRECP